MILKYNLTNKRSKVLLWITSIGFLSIYIFASDAHRKSTDKLFVKIDNTKSANINNCTVIVHGPLGRLGNVLFEFATAYGLSLEHSCHLYIGPGFIKQLGESFEINLSNLMTKNELNLTSSIKRIYNHCTYFPDLLQPNTSQTIELIGYWQVQKYFINSTDEIRHQLRFKQNILNRTNHFITTNINRSISNVVGIHIRRGDFVGMRPISTDKFVFDAMDYFIKKYHLVKFIIVSDDKLHCRNVFGKRNDTFFTPDSFSPAEDMALLTSCDHLILTVGTFGWWGGFLLNNRTGEVITDAKPNHSPVDVNCDGSVFFPYWFSFLNTTK
jgi:galactoside 2-L-fucosyltransferase 1/2